MNVLGLALSLPLIGVAVMLSTLPVWMAAKVVGAGRQEFGRVAGALVLAMVLVIGLALVVGGWIVLLAPLVVLMTFSKLLETSYVGAFALCVLALAFQALMAKMFGSL